MVPAALAMAASIAHPLRANSGICFDPPVLEQAIDKTTSLGLHYLEAGSRRIDTLPLANTLRSAATTVDLPFEKFMTRDDFQGGRGTIKQRNGSESVVRTFQ